MCSLQWISWKDFGTVIISQDSDKTVHVKGGQKSKTNSDYLQIDGTLTAVNPHTKQTIILPIINNGETVTLLLRMCTLLYDDSVKCCKQSRQDEDYEQDGRKSSYRYAVEDQGYCWVRQ